MSNKNKLITKTAKNKKLDDEVLAKRLVNRFKQGDQSAFTELMSLYHNQIAALAYRMVGDYDEAADIVQEVFIKMVRCVNRYDDTKRFYTWLYRISFNATIDHIRKNKRHQHESIENFHDSLESLDHTPENKYSQIQISGCIKKAAEELNPKQRSVFFLRDIQGRKVGDVADILKIPQATVRWYLHRARERIKEELKNNYPNLLLQYGLK